MKLSHLLCTTLVALFTIGATLEGPNVCFVNNPEVVDVTINTTKVIVRETFGWCWDKLPFPRCRKKKTTTIKQTKKVPRVQYVKVEKCCEGYVQAANNCIPFCTNVCLHGRCIGPNECECTPGWGGSNCNLTCESNRWGVNCSKTCNCHDGARCDPVNGLCICLPGFQSTDCVHHCECFNGGTCNNKTGICDCPPGYSGTSCEAKCSSGSFGKYCSQACNCNNNDCNFISGECFCMKGFYGEHCQEKNCSIIDCNKPFDLLSLRNEEKSTSLAPIILTACLLCIFILCVAALLILKNKKKIHELKNELAFVSYSASEKAQDRFDNPVYAYPNQPYFAANLNDLSSIKQTLQKDISSEEGAVGGSTSAQSLNIYHNEKIAKEPIYDEIPFDKNIDHYDQPKFTIRSNFSYPKEG